MQAVAPTMLYDVEVMGYTDRGAAIPEQAVRSIDISTLLLAGDADRGAPAEVVGPA